MTGRIVAAAPHSDLQIVDAGEVESGRDICGPRTPCDHRRPTIDESVEADSRGFVFGVARDKHWAGERTPQFGQLAVGESAAVGCGLRRRHQTPSASMIKRAAAAPEYCCWPVIKLPSRTACDVNLPETMKFVP